LCPRATGRCNRCQNLSALLSHEARVPVLIGSGIPLVGTLERDIALTHVATRQYPSGLVQREYVVTMETRHLAPPLGRRRPQAWLIGPRHGDSTCFTLYCKVLYD